MKRIKCFALALLLASLFLLSGCGTSPLVGTWTSDESDDDYPAYMTLRKDGTATFESILEGTWKVQDDKLVLRWTHILTGTQVYTYDYEVDGSTLTLLAEDDYVENKVTYTK